VVPLSHWSHFSPVIPRSHSQRPVRRSHCSVAEPSGLHSHAETHQPIVIVCNSLPPSIVNFESLSSFRNLLNNINVLNAFDNLYSPYNVSKKSKEEKI